MKTDDPLRTAAADLLKAVDALGYRPSHYDVIELRQFAAALRLALYGPPPLRADEFVGCMTGD